LEKVDRSADIETLARMAARLAGRDPDEYLKMTLGEVTAFDDYIWRYPDFLNRAEAAYALLDAPVAPDLGSLSDCQGDGRDQGDDSGSAAGESDPASGERLAGSR